MGGALIAINTSVSFLFARNVIMKLHADIRKYRSAAPSSKKSGKSTGGDGSEEAVSGKGTQKTLASTSFNTDKRQGSGTAQYVDVYISENRVDNIRVKAGGKDDVGSDRDEAVGNSVHNGLGVRGTLAAAHCRMSEDKVEVERDTAQHAVEESGAGGEQEGSIVDNNKQSEDLRGVESVLCRIYVLW